MTQERKMIRKAADNKYLHKDFHNIMNIGLNYVEEKYGSGAVKEYLKQFSRAYYAPLKENIWQSGIDAIEAHIRDIYEKEEWLGHVSFERNEDKLTVKIEKCPAVSHIHKSGGQVSPLYLETTKTVYDTICEGTRVEFKMLDYSEENGAATLVFRAGKEGK